MPNAKIIIPWMGAALLFTACAGGSTAPASPPETGEEAAETPSLEGKTAILVIAPENFQDRELEGTQKELEAAGVAITLASTVTTEVTGMSGAMVTPAVTIAVAEASAYDAVVFIGGSGTDVLLDDPNAHALAKAGLLEGRNATCWEGGLENLAAKGATVVNEPVVTDGNIITGNGPDAASEFGKAIVAYLAAH
jgi:protease I